jgi:hypothetical protein
VESGLCNKSLTAPTMHSALSANLALPAELVDRVVDQVNHILVANVTPVDLFTTVNTKGTSAVLNQLVVLATSSNGPPAAAYVKLARIQIEKRTRRRGVPAMFLAICWQSEIRGEPLEDWFSKLESPHSLTESRASRLVAGAACAAAKRVAMMVRSWNCILIVDVGGR